MTNEEVIAELSKHEPHLPVVMPDGSQVNVVEERMGALFLGSGSKVSKSSDERH